MIGGNWKMLLALSLCVSTFGMGKEKYSIQNRNERRKDLIARLLEPDSSSKPNSLRDMAVYDLAQLARGSEDTQLVSLFIKLMKNDRDDWVRLEAAADIHFFHVPSSLEANVYQALRLCQQDPRVNFQVLASKSVIILSKKKRKVDSASVRKLAKISKGDGLPNWEVMVPSHNKGMTVAESSTQMEISIEESLKIGMRVRALEGLAISNDSYSRGVIADLMSDKEPKVRDAAKAMMNRIE